MHENKQGEALTCRGCVGISLHGGLRGQQAQQLLHEQEAKAAAARSKERREAL